MKAGNNTRSSSRYFSSLAAGLMCALGLGIGGSTASAQAIYGTGERPVEDLFMGQTTYSQEQGTVQMSIGGQHGRSGEMRSNELSGRVEYGITDQLQAQASFPLDITDRAGTNAAQTSASRVEVGAKYSVLPQNAPVSLAAGMDVEVPLGSQDFSGNRPVSGPTYKPSLMVGTGSGIAQVHASVQGELGQVNQGLNSSVGGMLDLGVITPTLEVSSMAMENTLPEVYATPGVTYSFSDRAELGVGAAIGLNESSEDVRVLAKFNFQLR